MLTGAFYSGFCALQHKLECHRNESQISFSRIPREGALEWQEALPKVSQCFCIFVVLPVFEFVDCLAQSSGKYSYYFAYKKNLY